MEELQRIIDAHVTGEAEHIAGYRQIVTEVRDPLIATLVALVVADEERHHELLRKMAARLRDDLEMTRSPDALKVSPVGYDETGTLAERTRAYADDEHKGAKILRRNAREAGGLYGGAFALLLETMARDSEKHELIMRFIIRRLDHAG